MKEINNYIFNVLNIFKIIGLDINLFYYEYVVGNLWYFLVRDIY